jgi:tetratricopeptide (TPR) repeat protein
MSRSAADLTAELVRQIKARDWTAAQPLSAELAASHPEHAPAWLAASHLAVGMRRIPEALRLIDRAVRLEPENPRYLIHRAQVLLELGRRAEAVECTVAAERAAASDPILLDTIGGLFNFANDHARALAAYDRAVGLAPDNAHFLFNRAAVRRFLGELAAAEDDYDRVIRLRPRDYEAYRNRSDLRTQTPQRNHVAQLRAVLAQHVPDWRGEVQLRFALAKELEDLGDHADSFRELARGAALRRAHLQYDPATDIATVDWIIEAYPRAPAAPDVRAPTDSPIFIVGLPRSGTTLVDRILSSHSAVRSAGELNDFALAVVASVGALAGPQLPPRRELVARSAGVDFAALGADYLRRARAGGAGPGRFTDKMPLNYLYCGLIRRALPQAKIVHLVRHPLAVCYAMYKNLFQDGYPFSYDLGEIGRYYLAYRRLMDHWRSTMPGVIHTVAYESLVADQLGESRRLLAYCGLEWEPACGEFHRNPYATTTASAAQVRRPIYDSSVAQWRRYATQLEPLRRQLEAAGIDVS